MQSKQGAHVAIIMDGNGRWATRRGLPRSAGHAAGVEALRRIVEAAPRVGIGALTVFAFSADNWRRPHAEVACLMALLARYLARDATGLAEAGVRLSVIGRRDRLPAGLRDAIEAAEQATRTGAALHLRVAVDYSSREAILAAARTPPEDPAVAFSPDVDLLIRTGGEKRLSDFLLWECAYAELLFTDVMWPDFEAPALAEAMTDFARRERRFGALSPVAAKPAHAA